MAETMINGSQVTVTKERDGHQEGRMTMNSQVVSYECEACKYRNRWTRNEILQGGEQVVYKGQYVYHEYSMPCQNPARPRCGERHVVDVPIWEE